LPTIARRCLLLATRWRNGAQKIRTREVIFERRSRHAASIIAGVATAELRAQEIPMGEEKAENVGIGKENGAIRKGSKQVYQAMS
jgi:hypothetical protein